MVITEAIGERSNYVFLGEAGCGKSEIAVNLAIALAKQNTKPVHFFDLDMTKPLFRSRDVQAQLEQAGVKVHFEVQFFDAPTAVGGPRVLLRDPDVYTILDVGGDYMGASAIGAYAPFLRGAETGIFYVINSYRPWSMRLEHIDGVLSQVLGVTHLSVEHLEFIANCNLGIHTTEAEVHEGGRKLLEMLDGCAKVGFGCVWEELWPMAETEMPLVPLHLYFTYPWETEE